MTLPQETEPEDQSIDAEQPRTCTVSTTDTTAPPAKKKNRKKKKASTASLTQTTSPPNPVPHLPTSSETPSSFNTVVAAGWGAPFPTPNPSSSSWTTPTTGIHFTQGGPPSASTWSAEAEHARLTAKSTKGWGSWGWAGQSSTPPPNPNSITPGSENPQTDSSKPTAQPSHLSPTTGWDVPVIGVQMFSAVPEDRTDIQGVTGGAWNIGSGTGTDTWNTPVSPSLRMNIQDDIDLTEDPNALEGSLAYDAHIEELDEEEQ
ncbi:hypothetical protein HK097_000021 [Rhizophlyctis rosea]|uniref:Uncharacterized protein n=1 Tax=Rhizophlyctis rosea TaxID=64517 RepID=A0AAD5X5H2_9FUNG|nr:hypothetical protein HK097_000021 [Rhizophlyctis rosea]